MKAVSRIHAEPRGGAITPECEDTLANQKAEEKQKWAQQQWCSTMTPLGGAVGVDD